MCQVFISGDGIPNLDGERKRPVEQQLLSCYHRFSSQKKKKEKLIVFNGNHPKSDPIGSMGLVYLPT